MDLGKSKHVACRWTLRFGRNKIGPRLWEECCRPSNQNALERVKLKALTVVLGVGILKHVLHCQNMQLSGILLLRGKPNR
jgi:hypothetical protein